jgi:hypothetical protein
MSITLSGKISFTPLADVLEQLRQRKATGVLTISSGEVKKSIYVKAGQIVFASSNCDYDRLGEVLVKTGKLSSNDYEKAVKIFKKNTGLIKLGAILVENDLITSKDLFGGLKDQVKEIIYSLFLLNDGDYQFEECILTDIIQLHLDLPDLITEIILRIKSEI